MQIARCYPSWSQKSLSKIFSLKQYINQIITSWRQSSERGKPDCLLLIMFFLLSLTVAIAVQYILEKNSLFHGLCFGRFEPGWQSWHLSQASWHAAQTEASASRSEITHNPQALQTQHTTPSNPWFASCLSQHDRTTI